MIAAVVTILLLAGGGTALYQVIGRGIRLPTDVLAGASGDCVGLEDDRDVRYKGWMQPGQADFSFEVSDDGRRLEVETMDDPVGGSPAEHLTWELDDVTDSTAVLRLVEQDGYVLADHGEDFELDLTFGVDEGLLHVEIINDQIGSSEDERTTVFEVPVDRLEDGSFGVAARTGGMMACSLD